MLLPSGSRMPNITGAPGERIGSASTSTPSPLSPLVLAEDVGRLDADRAAAGLVAHRRVERKAGAGARRGDLEPAHLAVLAEAEVGAHLVPELLGVEPERRVLVGDGEHRNADVGHGRGDLRWVGHGL
jgi:hypothetical protein